MVGTVRKALQAEHFTALRDIGVVGDAALVFTSNRARPDAVPDSDEIDVYTVSLRTLAQRKLLSAYQLHSVGWSGFVKDRRGELIATFTDCVSCDATTFLTSFYFDGKSDTWQARWMGSQKGAPLSSPHQGKDYELQQVYAVLPDREGQSGLVTWSHYDYSNSRRTEDFVYRYDVDPASNLDRVQRLAGKEASDAELHLCQADQAWTSVRSGQDLPVCQNVLRGKTVPSRHITTTPPAQNEGRSHPPRY